ncbi:MAG: corrinoid protein [Clostridia bacterium]|jgi:corrinoid protein of di/trimethylamine methyltransferase|nr:cobalamin-binding protein [Clostridiaceae bacterium]
MNILEEISALLQKGRMKEVSALVKKALEEGIEAKDILEKGLIAGMDVVGEKFKNNEVYVPDVLIAARAMYAGLDLLRPVLASSGIKSAGTVVIGTCKGDLHDIGKNLVKMMMEGKGLKIIDLGVDVPAEEFVKAAIENDAQVIACSALLTTTMGEMKNVVDKVTEAGIRDKVTIMVGGAPVNENYCKSIGADIYRPDAASAAEAALAACMQK